MLSYSGQLSWLWWLMWYLQHKFSLFSLLLGGESWALCKKSQGNGPDASIISEVRKNVLPVVYSQIISTLYQLWSWRWWILILSFFFLFEQTLQAVFATLRWRTLKKITQETSSEKGWMWNRKIWGMKSLPAFFPRDTANGKTLAPPPPLPQIHRDHSTMDTTRVFSATWLTRL